MIYRRARSTVPGMGYQLEPDIQAHYGVGLEGDRLSSWGRLEAIRTRELLDRYLPPAPATVYDIGGAEGPYALPLARAGYAVHLLDPFPPHVAAARDAASAQPDAPLASAEVGDARELPYADATADAVLLLGPLYHLVERADRLRALTEARRVLRPGGVLLAAAISRFASLLDGLSVGIIGDPVFETIVGGALSDGVHRNPDPVGRPEWFTLAYFHHPDELREDVVAGGFADVAVLAVEGTARSADPAALDDPARLEATLRALRRVEREPALLGASPHLIAVANAPLGDPR
jgi:SAM-dependent methyltransferase